MALPFLPITVSGGGPASRPRSFRFRGLYVESTWGPDLMTLDDWRHLIDEMALLQLNSLGIGVYGCWPAQYDGKRTEFLMVPFPEHPGLLTPQTVRWYSPATGAEHVSTYLPRMFQADFFGQIVAYGRTQGIAVRPHFNGPGHSTLIPTVYPEVSAKDAGGRPTGYGYCLTSPRTYELLFSLYDSLIVRHLQPHGATWWHLGIDEVNAAAGYDEADPGRLVDPWCRCPDCAGRSKTRLLVDFTLRSIQHLLHRGINDITLWHDALTDVNAWPLLKEELSARGIGHHVAVQWWGYDDSPHSIGERQLRSWVTPMAGYWPNRFHHEYGANIHAQATEGAAAGSEGIEAYCIYDPADLWSYAYVAAAGLDPSLGVPAFEQAFSDWLFEGMRVPPAFSHARTLFDSAYGPLGQLLDSLLPSAGIDPVQRAASYPHQQIRQLAADPLDTVDALRAVQVQAQALRQACAGAAPSAADSRRRRLLVEYACEAGKIAGLVQSFLHAAAGWNHYRNAQRAALRVEIVASLTRAQAAFTEASRSAVEVMHSIERDKAPYLQPHVLREITPLHRWLTGTRDRVRTLGEEVEAGGLDEIPPL